MTRRSTRGFTLIEAVVASALLGLVGAATAGFLGAFARGAEARSRLSDPAIEGALLSRRVAAMAPAVRGTLSVGDDCMAIWLSDRVPSRTVHASELGWLRFDAESKAILFERIPEAAFRTDRALEEEFAADEDFVALRAEYARDGVVTSTVVAEGVERASFARGSVELGGAHSSARVRVIAGREEEPLR